MRISGACEQGRQWRHSLELLEDMRTAQPSDLHELCYPVLLYRMRRLEFCRGCAAVRQGGLRRRPSGVHAGPGPVLLPRVSTKRLHIHFWGLEMAGGLADGAPSLQCHVIVLRAEGLISAASVRMSGLCTSEDADICSSAVVACEAGSRFHTVAARCFPVRF